MQPHLPLTPRLVRPRATLGYQHALEVRHMRALGELRSERAKSAWWRAECKRLQARLDRITGAEPGWRVSRAMVAR